MRIHQKLSFSRLDGFDTAKFSPSSYYCINQSIGHTHEKATFCKISQFLWTFNFLTLNLLFLHKCNWNIFSIAKPTITANILFISLFIRKFSYEPNCLICLCLFYIINYQFLCRLFWYYIERSILLHLTVNENFLMNIIKLHTFHQILMNKSLL